jgi:hypothetical protein
MNKYLSPVGLSDEEISECMILFIKEFTQLVKTITNETPEEHYPKNEEGKYKTPLIKKDIRLGIPIDYIENRRNTTSSNISKIASRMKKKEKILDRRKKEWLGLINKFDER